MSDGGRGPERPASPGVDRTLTVLEQLVTAEEGLTLTALAKVTRIPLATCASIVYTLEHRGYATRKVIGRSHFWRPTLRLYGLASQLVRKVDLSQIAIAEMRALAEELGMPVHIGVLDGASVVYVAKAATPGFIQFDTYPGKVAPFDLTALGRAIAAHLPEDELAVLLPHLSAGQGPRAHGSSPEAFKKLLERVRTDGYAVEEEEEQAEISCLAAPCFNAEGRVAGSVGVTGFARDLVGDRRDAAARGVVHLSIVISRRLGCRPGALPSELDGSYDSAYRK
ncbi:helix-turn-helix domain-containing protein [Nonomuraea phyllanthi]|uniref:Helix-turn-helix domain-containing protein n=1 Tax=Nonomuraea phyllanthi TaxID=2219224 RepID=A0A5C4WHV9_9ACTN|nr:IclR family transcriptional regulator [Nonomuraea phyllanthi]KAB8194197.1 helix-turn-helix domain-containing protein [Nonomuraea phyllanthi]QFY07797.1 helix-turn-helix domain-containing protein [Nonomuraea phyllanthi]